jgi:hypothetical protein
VQRLRLTVLLVAWAGLVLPAPPQAAEQSIRTGAVAGTVLGWRCHWSLLALRQRMASVPKTLTRSKACGDSVLAPVMSQLCWSSSPRPA